MIVEKTFEKYFKANTWVAFAAIIIIYFIALALEFQFVFTDEFYTASLAGEFDYDTLTKFIHDDRGVEWVNYLIVFIVVLAPALLISLSLNTGAVFREYKIRFRQIFDITLKAQIVFALNYLVSVLFKAFGIIEKNWNTIDNNYFYQSAAYFFREKGLPFWMMYPLQIINITEIVHVLVLALGFAYISKFGYFKSLGFVLLFYGIALVIWIIFTIFLQTILSK